MPLQNRVTPFGDIVVNVHRGTLTGNRGIIHDQATKTLMKRRWTSKAWIVCLCEFKGRRRSVMATRSWTELFFLDEATAFAAGHRPCFYCRRADANSFRDAWSRGNGSGKISARHIDDALHKERLEGKFKRRHPLPCDADRLPDGTMIAAGDLAYVMSQRVAWRWSPAGYTHVNAAVENAMLLTPPSIVRALRAGYRPSIDASASCDDARHEKAVIR